MGKLLIWFVVVLVVLIVARIAGRSVAARQVPPGRQGRPAASARNGPTAGNRGNKANRGNTVAAPAEPMVRCAHCGVHLPRSEALLIGGRTWCSQDHARLGSNQ